MSLISFSALQDGVTSVSAAPTNNAFNTIFNDYNGNITNANIASNAAIAASKISYASASNPYKFNVYLTTGQNIGTANTKISFDTKNFDTGSNVDIVTNKGRFTAPVAGFYQFNCNIFTTSAGTGTNVALYLYKNGSQIVSLDFIPAVSGTTPGLNGSTILQLSVNDFIEVYAGTATSAKALDVSSATNNTFSGFFVANT